MSPTQSRDVLPPPQASLSEIHEQIRVPKPDSPVQFSKFSLLGRNCPHHSLIPNPMTKGVFFFKKSFFLVVSKMDRTKTC